MNSTRALSLGGAAALVLTSWAAIAARLDADMGISRPTASKEAIRIAEAASGDGVTSYYAGDKPEGAPAWAAEATMNPDYSADAPAAAAEAPAPAGGDGVTSFFGINEAAEATPAWAAEAAMNPDYSSEPSAPAAEAPATEAAAAEEAPPQPTGGDGVTSFFATETPAEAPAWAAAATMNPDYSAAPSVVTPAVATDAAAPAPCISDLGANSGKIVFSQSSSSVSPSSYGTLDSIAKIINGCGDVVVEVAGHTDNTGRPASNAKLSELRANAVVKYLTNAGVDGSKLKAVGYGQDNPVASNDTADGRRQNRRIEFSIK